MIRYSTKVLLIGLSFIGGIALRSWVDIPILAAYILGCMGTVLAVVIRKRERWRMAAFYAAVAMLGVGRLELAYTGPGGNDPSFFIGKDALITGVVAKDPERRLKTMRMVVEVEQIEDRTITHTPVDGKTLIITSALTPFEIGDRVVFRCDLAKPEPIEDFDYPRFLAKDGIFSICNFPVLITREAGVHAVRWGLAQVKRDFIYQLERVVPEPESAFLAGILTGSRGRIPEGVIDDFKTSGISHLLAISGYNIVIIATVVLGLLTMFVRRPLAFPILSVIIAGFVLMVGGEASVVRAGVMGLVLHAWYIADRLYRPGSILTLTAAVMLLQNPRLLRDDLGFDLSFLATWGIFVLGPIFMARFRRITNRLHFREAIAITCAAQAATLPLLVGSFDRISLVSLPANIFIVPFIPLVMVVGFAAGIAGVLPGVGQVVGAAAFAVGRIIIVAAHWFAALPLASLMLPSSAWYVVTAFYGLAGIAWWQRERVQRMVMRIMVEIRRRPTIQPAEKIKAQSVEYGEMEIDLPLVVHYKQKSNERDTPGKGGVHFSLSAMKHLIIRYRIAVIIIAGIGLLTLIFLPQYLSTRRFTVTIFDVGQGDSILVSAPGGQQLLIDGGPDATVLSKLGKTLPWWDRTIEYLVLTHPHADHVVGLVDVLKRYQVKKVLMTGVTHATDEYAAFLSVLEGNNVTLETPIAGYTFEVGDASVSVLAPLQSFKDIRVPEVNDASIVLKVEYGEFTSLFTGDAGIAGEPALIERWGEALDVDILKVGHHGSNDASSQGFIDAASPDYAIISVGEGNTYGHPSPRVVKRLERARVKMVRTDADGDVRVISDGKNFKVVTKR